jgi:hypothetical protein
LLAQTLPQDKEEATIEAVVTGWVPELDRLGISLALRAVNDGSKDGAGVVLQRLAERSPGSALGRRPLERGFYIGRTKLSLLDLQV